MDFCKNVESHIQYNIIETMELVKRTTPAIGMFEVIKNLDPRLVSVTFRDASYYLPDEYDSYSDDSDEFDELEYKIAYDRHGEVIRSEAKVNDKHCWLLLSSAKKVESECENQYFITCQFYQIDENEDDLTKYLYKSIYVGDNIDQAIFSYLDYVTTHRM